MEGILERLEEFQSMEHDIDTKTLKFLLRDAILEIEYLQNEVKILKCGGSIAAIGFWSDGFWSKQTNHQ